MPSTRQILVLPLLLLFVRGALAQVEFEQRVAKVDQDITKLLVQYGRRAEGMKLPSRARIAYQLILDYYDGQQPTARKGLGYKKVRDEWVADAIPLAADVVNAKQQDRLQREWDKTSKAVGRLHGEFGMSLHAAGDIARAHHQLRRALQFRDDVAEWHLALGHVEANGFYGTQEQVDFVQRFQAMRSKAKELASKEYEVSDLPAAQMPAALQKSGLPFFGARSQHFTHWVVDSAEDARSTLQWAERCYDLLGFLAGESAVQGMEKRSNWFAILRNHEQRDILLENSPATRGNYTLEQAKLFGGTSFRDGSGISLISWHRPKLDADRCVANVVKYHLVAGCNDGLSEGAVHALTWLLADSVLTWYTSLQHTVTKDLQPLKKLPDAWRERLDQEIATDTDWQLDQIPRERIDNFRDSARIKSWSFLLFLMARYPDKWLDVVRNMGRPKGLTVEAVAACYEKYLGCTVGELDAEWRAWARQGSRIGAASNW